jgi:hypothetical protein
MNYAAVDFETFYSDECTIKKLGVDGYVRHQDFDCYLVSIVTDTGLEWVGHPKDAPWDKISGLDWEWLAHNAGFDERVHYYLKKWGRIPSTAEPRLWHCTADLCAFSAAPRALAEASLYLFQKAVSKDYRKLMKGRVFRDLPEEKQEKVREAGLADARTCLRFWKELSPAWPEDERRVSRLSREQAWRGIKLDREALENDVKWLGTIIWHAQQMIPWHGTDDATLGYESLVKECRKVGIDAPPSVAMTSEPCAAWEETHGDQYPWIDGMRTVRRANALLKKVQTMLVRIRPEDSRMPYENKYFGAHTGRWGDGGETYGRYKAGGFNSRNLPRAEMFGEEFFLGKLKPDGTREVAQGRRFGHLWKPGMHGVNLRHRIIPAEGCRFDIADLSAIEPKVLWKLAGDIAALTLASKGMHPYEIHARGSMGYDLEATMKDAAKANKSVAAMYQLAKARVLALGFQAGWVKFIQMAATYIARDECERIFSAPVSVEQTKAFTDYLQKVKVPTWNALWSRGTETERVSYVNSWLIVSDFRTKNKKITAFWRRLQTELERAIGDDLIIELPSGRSLKYRKVARIDGEITATIIRNGRPIRTKLYGGKLAENVTQAVARDVFVACMLRVVDAEIWVPLHAHDEAVSEVPIGYPDDTVQNLMAQSPSWWPTFPVSSECEPSMFYKK